MGRLFVRSIHDPDGRAIAIIYDGAERAATEAINLPANTNVMPLPPRIDISGGSVHIADRLMIETFEW